VQAPVVEPFMPKLLLFIKTHHNLSLYITKPYLAEQYIFTPLLYILIRHNAFFRVMATREVQEAQFI
jgi:hypothetical protein